MLDGCLFDRLASCRQGSYQIRIVMSRIVGHLVQVRDFVRPGDRGFFFCIEIEQFS